MKYLILVLFSLLLFINNDSLALWEQDEAAYAGFAYNMVEKEQYLIPDFEWSWPHRKPPLHFWLIAGSYKVFGYNEFATRLPSAIAILLCVFLIYFFTLRLYSQNMALWASYIFMGSLLMPLYGKISLTDASLLLCFMGSYFSIHCYLKEDHPKWLVSLLIFIASGALLKGPPIFIPVCGAILMSFFFGQRKKLFLKLFLISIIGIIPFSVWAYGTWLLDGGKFFNWWMDWYILKRTSGTIYGQTGFIGYYLLVFILCFLPWFLFIPLSLKNLVKDTIRKHNSDTLLFQFGWLLFGWIFYEIIRSKLPSYAFAVIPIWCTYIAKTVLAFKEEKITISKLSRDSWASLWILLAFGILIYRDRIPYDNMQFIAFVLACFFFLFGLLYWLSSRLKFLKNRLPELALGFALGLNFIAWGIAIPAFEPTRRFPKLIAERLVKLNSASKHVFFSSDYSMSSLPVYLAWSGFKFQTADRENYDQCTQDSLQYSSHELFMIQRRNFHSLTVISDSFKLSPIYGWISDRGVVDTYFIAERVQKN